MAELDFEVTDEVDITDKVCPLTFVKAKVAIEELEDGEILAVRMNDGEPVQNVPRSMKEEGHKVLKLTDNKAALPLAFFVESDMGDVENEPYNCFVYENEIYRNISDEVGEPVFSQTDWKLINSENCTMESDGSLLIDDTEKESYVDYQLQIDKEGSYYVQYLGSQVSTVTLIVNGEQEILS